MKVIVLSKKTSINGKLYRKGEVVQVADSFSMNVLKTIVQPTVVAAREIDQKAEITSIITKQITPIKEIIKEPIVLIK